MEVLPGAFKSSGRTEARQLLERLLDQNEQAMGLFYLHPDGDFAFGEPAVAFLRVSVALRDEHYAVLTEARRGRLNAEFRAKFGWLIGNLYSRAAARDWADSPEDRAAASALIGRLIDKSIWVEDALIDAAQGKVDLSAISPDSLIDELEKHRPPPPIQQAATEIARQFRQMFKHELTVLDEELRGRAQTATATITEELREKLQDTGNLDMDAVVQLVRSALEAESQLPSISDLLADDAVDEIAKKFGRRIENNGRIRRLLPK